MHADSESDEPLIDPPSAPEPSLASLREVASMDILQGAKEVLIRHGAETYRLRLTRNGKLILHK